MEHGRPIGEVLGVDEVAEIEGWGPDEIAAERASASLYWVDTEARRHEFRRFGTEWTDSEIDAYLVSRRAQALQELREDGIAVPPQLLKAVTADEARASA